MYDPDLRFFCDATYTKKKKNKRVTLFFLYKKASYAFFFIKKRATLFFLIKKRVTLFFI